MVSFLNPFAFGSVAAPDLAYSTDGVLAHKTAGEVYNTSDTFLDWAAEDYDRTGWHDNVTNNQRLTVPSGPALLRFGSASAANGSSTKTRMLQWKNGITFTGRGANMSNPNVGGTAGSALNAWSAILAATPGDYLEASMQQASSSSTSSTENFTWASAEILDPLTRYAFVTKSVNQATSNGVAAIMAWGAEVADVGGWHDTVTNNSRLTVPGGVRQVRVSANVTQSSGGGSNILVRILKNGATAKGLPVRQQGSASQNRINLVSAVIEVVPGDYLEIEVTQGADTIIVDDATWFCIEEIPAAYKRALVYKTGNQAILANTPTVMAWDAEEYDTDGMHDPVTNNSRITVPPDCTQARASFSLDGTTAINGHAGYATKNGSTYYGMPKLNTNVTALGADTCAMGAWVDVTPVTDYFELVAHSNDQARTINANDKTWFCLECR